MEERYREYGEEPEGKDNAKQVIVPLYEGAKTEPADLFPVAVDALCCGIVAGHVRRYDARRAHFALAEVALAFGKSGAANHAAFLVLQCRLS